MLNDAVKNLPPVIGTNKELKQILDHRRSLRTGFGLPVNPQVCPTEPIPAGMPPIACGEDLCGLQEQQRLVEEAREALDQVKPSRFLSPVSRLTVRHTAA